ncbi:MAG: glycosyltransferase [Planctomycetota bacterium]
MISVVIPAHNEQAVIARCLESLTARPVARGLEVIVACNGCTDNTAEVARGFGGAVKVVETEVGSKIAGLNLGDAAATGFPRVYLDADVEVSLDAIEKVVDLLEAGPALAAAPRMNVDLSQSSWAVRAFYKIWLSQPYHGKGMIGGGFYAMSEAGRSRFDTFPDIIADDEFTRSLFSEAERATPDNTNFTIRAPHTLSSLIKVKTRSRLGLYQLRKHRPDLDDNREEKGGPDYNAVLARPTLWPCAAVYVLVNLITRTRAKRQMGSITTYTWERDESSRQHAPAT